VQDLTSLPADESEALYQLRCALVHQIGLTVVSQSYRKGTEFGFKITDAVGAPAIRKMSDSRTKVSYSVGFWELKRYWLEVITKLRSICQSTTDPRSAHVIAKIGNLHSERLLKR
jgi:hypothetical protein